MKATELVHNLGQSLWLDNITRDLLNSGTRYIDELSVTGLTSNPTIRSRVVSMPSWDIFEHQSQEYRDSVLPPEVEARVAVEQARLSDGNGMSAPKAK